MPRTRRESTGGLFCHVLNRGNGRAQVFHDEADYQGFMNLMAKASRRASMRVAAWCLMPNHFHFVLWPRADGDLSRFMHWLMTSHVGRYHRKYGGSGHVWQGRYKSFALQGLREGSQPRRAEWAGDSLWLVLRYVERNALRAGLVVRAESWRWSSAYWWAHPSGASPIAIALPERPANWLEVVNTPLTDSELAAARRSVGGLSP